MEVKLVPDVMTPSEIKQELLISGISSKTASRYARIIDTVHRQYGSISLYTAKQAIAEQIRNNSPASANKYILAMKAYCKINKLEWAREFKRIKETPTPKRQPSVELAMDIVFIPPEQTRSLAIHRKYSVLFELLFLTGMRLDEARNLKLKNISDSEIIVEKSKTGPGRRIATPPAKKVIKRLFEYVDTVKSEYLFPNDQNLSKPLSDGACRKEFKNRLTQLGVIYNYTPHSFRGAFMTRNLREGAVLFDVQDIVGHKSAESTKIYYRGDIDTQRELMKRDPANTANLAPEEQFKHLIESVRKAGIFDKKCFTYKLTEHSLHIEIKSNK